MSAAEDDGESSNSEMIDINEDDSNDARKEDLKKERAEQLGYEPQKEIVYNKILPYSGKTSVLDFLSKFKNEYLGDVDKESTKWFADIKSNLGRAIALRELRPGMVTWISRLNKYIRMYGLKFPKHDHISLIKLLMSFVTTEGMLK